MIAEPAALRGLVMVVFTEVPASPATKRSLKVAPAPGAGRAARDRKLEQIRQELLRTREDAQTSREELRAANEELQSTNEELQSTNEELTTSKEEMQSMNEELQTLNNELELKVDELGRLNNDLRNLLDSTQITTVFLDTALRVRLFTAGPKPLLRLIATDVGRPLTDITSELGYPNLAEDARQVLRTLTPHEQEAPAGEGTWFMVRLMPYRTLDNVIDGVVITFSDISDSKALEHRLRAMQTELETRIADQDRTLEKTIGRPASERNGSGS